MSKLYRIEGLTWKKETVLTWDVNAHVQTPTGVETLNMDGARIIRIPREWEGTVEGKQRIESILKALSLWTVRHPKNPVIVVPTGVEFLKVTRITDEEGGT